METKEDERRRDQIRKTLAELKRPKQPKIPTWKTATPEKEAGGS